MASIKYSYLVIENATDVCEGIAQRMQPFSEWQSLGYCVGVKEAISAVTDKMPDLIFIDWGLNGGSAFEVLQVVQNIAGYNPYIIFNTGFQKDNPEIPQEIINHYRVDKYLIKPIWETLRINLAAYVQEAAEKKNQKVDKKLVWVQDDAGIKQLIDLTKLACIVQHPLEARVRNFYFSYNPIPLPIPLQWNNCYDLLKVNDVSFFITKSRSHVVMKAYIEKFDRPFVRLKGVDAFKIDVAKERLPVFEKWLSERQAIAFLDTCHGKT